MKKNELNYFDEFIKSSNYSCECAEMLLNFFKNFDKSKMPETIIKMHELEHEADDLKHKLTNYLLKDFLPPIEMEDIIELSQKLDDVVDFIEEILINIDIFNINKFPKEILDCLELLVNCTKNVNSLLIEFKNFKKSNFIKAKVIELNRLEEVGDKMYIDYMRNLYKNTSNSIDIIIWTKIYTCFEDCFDSCEDVADCIESIVLKNS